MQNAKDTFYRMLQSRLAALNPARTIVLRGAVRPAVLVAENELPTAAIATDAFRLQWTGMHVDPASPMPLVTLQCSIHYATDGTPGNSSMDRGRALAAMDAELASALTTPPHRAPKQSFAGLTTGAQPSPMATSIAWADPVFGSAELSGERLSRTVTVQVVACQEAGEL